jgi:hypothetical protein
MDGKYDQVQKGSKCLIINNVETKTGEDVSWKAESTGHGEPLVPLSINLGSVISGLYVLPLLFQRCDGYASFK